MADTVIKDLSAIPLVGSQKLFVLQLTHDFETDPCLSADTLSYLLPEDIMLLGGSVTNLIVGTTANLAVGVTGNTDYIVAALAVQTIAAEAAAADNATPNILVGATNYLILNPDADMIKGQVKIKLICASLKA